MEEYAQFRRFYTIVFDHCGYPDEQARIDALAEDAVYNDEKFVFFDDVKPALQQLHERYALGIVSDTWPSLERVFENHGLRGYFSSFVMSSVHGITKEDPALFRIALDDLGVTPEQSIFVDDSKDNLAVAESIGLHSVLINRYAATIDDNCRVPVIQSLGELIGLL